MPNYKLNITEEEENGIRQYLFATGDSKVTNMDIANFLQNIISSTINSPAEAVSDYIAKQSL